MRLSPDEVAQLVADYDAGQPTTALMKTYSIGKGTVLRLLRAEGVVIRHQSMSEDEVQQVINLSISPANTLAPVYTPPP